MPAFRWGHRWCLPARDINLAAVNPPLAAEPETILGYAWLAGAGWAPAKSAVAIRASFQFEVFDIENSVISPAAVPCLTYVENGIPAIGAQIIQQSLNNISSFEDKYGQAQHPWIRTAR